MARSGCPAGCTVAAWLASRSAEDHHVRALLLPVLFLAFSVTASTADELDPALAEQVVVQNLTLRGDLLTGTIVNHSSRAVRGIQLQITYGWLWSDERHPGADNPGRTEMTVLTAEIPAGGSAPFSYRPSTPLPVRTDGQFVPAVRVTGITEVIPAPGATQ
jgi:hypothetical protein